MAYLVGNCRYMCPTRERRRREQDGRLHPFEVLPKTAHLKKPKADSRMTVKEFQRPAAGLKQAQAEDIRPPDILKKTTTYLMTQIVPRQDVPWIVVYDFIFDRLRALRQDVTIQQCSGEDTICVFEQAVRFYTYADYRLCEEPLSAFDPHINDTHLQECLKHLIILYEMEDSLANSSEITALYLLHNLGSTDALSYALSLPEHVRNNPAIKAAMATSTAWMQQNFVRVLRNVAALPFLQACSIRRHLNKIHRLALLIMNMAHSSQNTNYPKAKLGHLLLLENDDQTEKICSYYGIKRDGSFVKFSKGYFCTEKQLLQSRQYGFLKQKSANVDIVDLITGKTIALSSEKLKNS